MISVLRDPDDLDSTVRIEVTNRIAWLRGKPAGSGYGLVGMQERASASGGAVTAGPEPGGWFRVRAVLAAQPQGVRS